MKIDIIKKEKTVNFRSFLIIALFVLSSVFCALITLSVVWLGALLFGLSICLCIFFGLLYGKKQKRSPYKYITFIVCAVFMCAAFASFLIIENDYSFKIDGEAQLSGMIESDTTVDGIRYIFLSKVKIDGASIGGRVKLSVNSGEIKTDGKSEPESESESEKLEGNLKGNLKSGTLISVNCHVKNVDLVDGFNVDGTAFRNNIRYYAEAQSVTSLNITGKTYPGLMTKIREAIYNRLVEAMGEENGALTYGMFTGDKAYLSGEIRDYFTVAGLSHILAVSGLHLSILCIFLMFILSKLRVNRKINAVVCLAAVIFYMFLADFSPSILRAGIMAVVGIYVYLTGLRGDILNSLSFAFCLILAIAPFFLFEAGFILSVCCVFGIALFSATFNRFFKKIKLPGVFARPLSVSLSAQIGILPACIYVFKSFQLYSLIVNIVMIPCIALVFIAIFVSLLFSFITTLNFPLSVCGYGISGVDYVAKNVATLPYAKVIVYSTQLIFISYALYFVMSRYVIKRSKILIPLLCVAQCVMLTVLQNPVAVSKESIVPVHFSYSNVSIISAEGGNYIVGDFWSGAAIRNKLKSLKIRSVNGILINKLDENIAEQIIVFNKTFRDFEVYFSQDSATEEAIESLNQVKSLTLNGFGSDGLNSENAQKIALKHNFHAVFEGGQFRAYGFISGNICAIFVPFGKNYTLFKSITQYNIVRSNYYFPSWNVAAIFLVGVSESTDLGVISCTNYADYAFNYKNGEVYIPKTTLI